MMRYAILLLSFVAVMVVWKMIAAQIVGSWGLIGAGIVFACILGIAVVIDRRSASRL